MPLTEAQIINATEAFIDRNHLSHFTFTLRDLFPKPTLSVLLAYEEEMRRLHELAGSTESTEPSDFMALLEHHQATERENAQLRSICLCPNGHGQMQAQHNKPLAPGGPVGTSWKCATCGIERMWPD